MNVVRGSDLFANKRTVGINSFWPAFGPQLWQHFKNLEVAVVRLISRSRMRLRSQSEQSESFSGRVVQDDGDMAQRVCKSTLSPSRPIYRG